MPALKCPHCGASDLHAVNIEVAEPKLEAPAGIERTEKTELACKRCGWTPTTEAQPEHVVDIQPADANV